MPKAGEIKYCDILGGRKTNAAFVYVPPSAYWTDKENVTKNVRMVGISQGFWLQSTPLTVAQIEYLNKGKIISNSVPITSMNRLDIVKRFKNKSLRMPSAAEWELAARAGVGFKYKYPGSNDVKNVAWTNLSYMPRQHTAHAVAQLKSNNYGLHDMSGNVYQRMIDVFFFNYSKGSSRPQLNPKNVGTDSNIDHVARGCDFTADKFNCTIDSWRADHGKKNKSFGVRLVWDM